ncbi:MAG: type II toxin-antitoxin system VapC family toxin [Fidelibacterota bacterium]
MIVTVDTHIIIWEALEPGKLSKKAKHAFDRANESDGLIFCDISLWEISMLITKKRLEIEIPFLEFIDLIRTTRNYTFQSISPEIADISTNLGSEINSDPVDRIIAATAIYSNSLLITADQNFINSKLVSTIW